MRMLDSPQQTPDENLRVLIKRGPDKKETSLKELEENYASTPEWKVIEGGGRSALRPCRGVQDGQPSKT